MERGDQLLSGRVNSLGKFRVFVFDKVKRDWVRISHCVQDYSNGKYKRHSLFPAQKIMLNLMMRQDILK